MSDAPNTRGLLVGSFHDETAEQAHDLVLLRRLVPWLRPQFRVLSGALLLMPIAALATVLQPLFIKQAIDAAIVEHSAEALGDVIFLFAIAITVEFFARFGQTYFMQLAGQRAMADLRKDVFAHIQRLGVRYFDRTPVGRVVTRVTNDIDSLGELFASGAITALADLLTVVAIVGFMLYLDWELCLITFIALPPLSVAIVVFRRYARVAFRDIRLRVAQLNAYLAEQVDGIAVVQAYGQEDVCAQEYAKINGAYREANYRSIRFDALLYSVVQSVSVACVALVLYYASYQAEFLSDPAQLGAYVGTVVAFYEYIQKFFIPIRDLSTKYTIIQSSVVSAERVFSLLDVEEFDAPSGHGPISHREGCADAEVAVELRELSFAYHAGHPVVHDIDLQLKVGERLAIVGATGSGKTTLISLLLRLYDPPAGSVHVEGRDVLEWERDALRARFAVVPQDVFLFRGTVIENLAPDGVEGDRVRAEAALRRVGAWEMLSVRGGLDAPLEDRGENLSAGERQLVAFARALYRDASILILDEATANVDSESEHQLQQAVRMLLEETTAIVIAHRLSTIREVDRILVMHRGRVAEVGTHEELLAAGGVYAKLFRLQFGEESDPSG